MPGAARRALDPQEPKLPTDLSPSGSSSPKAASINCWANSEAAQFPPSYISMYNVIFFKLEFFFATKKQQILKMDFEKRKQKADKAKLVKAVHSCHPSKGKVLGHS